MPHRYMLREWKSADLNLPNGMQVRGYSFYSRSFQVSNKVDIRAWLSIADQAKEKQQDQVRPVINHVSLPVKSVNNVYDSAMETWIEAMKLMEELLLGKPHRVENGALLLGLSAWHIYPNLSVVTAQAVYVAQHDDLVPQNALITIGLLPKQSSSG